MSKINNRIAAEINLDNITSNLSKISTYLGPKTKINAVIKANAYGHGLVLGKIIAQEPNVKMLSVASVDEALELRKHQISAPILVLGYSSPERLPEVIKNQITITIFDFNQAQKISQIAKKLNKTVNVHLKVDTGMHRIGFEDQDLITQAYQLPNLKISGLFTHFARPEDRQFTNTQFQSFTSIIQQLRTQNYDTGILHASKSASVILHPNKNLDMVRFGLLLYGWYPSKDAAHKATFKLKPAIQLKARIAQVKNLPANQSVGYNHGYKTKRPTKIATITGGYADGYPRELSNKGQVLINGQLAPVIGNICMDYCMVDISKISGNVQSGDWATFFNDQLTVDDVAKAANTASHEILSRIGSRVPRFYFKNQQLVEIDKI